MKSWLRTLVLQVLLWIVLAAGLYFWFQSKGYEVTWRPRTGDIEGSEPIRIEAGTEVLPFEQGAADGARPSNIILILADGMGFSQVAAARALRTGLEGRLTFERLPVVGWQMTWAASGLYTDSAAAATAMATGHKVRTGVLSQGPDGDALPTVLERAQERGMRSGLVTDSYLWDATPAAFVAHVESRREKDAILAQMASSGIDLLVGGRGSFTPESADAETWTEAFEDQGYEVIWEWPVGDPWSADGRGIALLPRDTIASPEFTPHLADLMDLALERLANESGFFLMLETEETDTGGHAHDLRRVVDGIVKLDEAVRRAVDFAQADGRTLVLVTSDHDTGGPSLLSGTTERPLGVAWSTGSHTAEPVPIYAYGPGAERFGRVLDNTDIGTILFDLLDDQPAATVRSASSGTVSNGT